MTLANRSWEGATPTDVEAIVRGRHGDPFGVLGMHGGDGKPVYVCVFAPQAAEVAVREPDGGRDLAEQSVVVYLRKSDDVAPPVLVACNLTPVVRSDYRVGAPVGGPGREILNSDAEIYGGSNVATPEVSTPKTCLGTTGPPHGT
jgi:1,4-alpha-glucan branching enzyme